MKTYWLAALFAASIFTSAQAQEAVGPIPSAERANDEVAALLDKAANAKDDKERFRWLLQAAEAGDAFSMGAVGTYYFLGVGVPNNQAEAIRWYRAGADKQDGASTYMLALHVFGEKTPGSEAEAARLLHAAASLGDEGAIADLRLEVRMGGEQWTAADDAAKTNATILINRSKAQDQFVAFRKHGVAAARHKSSGLVCTFARRPDPKDEIRVSPEGARGDDVRCVSVTPIASRTRSAVRVRGEETEAGELARLVALARTADPSIKEAPADMVAKLTKGRAANTRPVAWLAGPGSAYTIVMAVKANGWLYGEIFRAEPDFFKQAPRKAALPLLLDATPPPYGASGIRALF